MRYNNILYQYIFVILKAYFINIYHSRWSPLPEMSGLLLLTSPLCYAVSLPTGQHNPTSDICIYMFWAPRKTDLVICVH